MGRVSDLSRGYVLGEEIDSYLLELGFWYTDNVVSGKIRYLAREYEDDRMLSSYMVTVGRYEVTVVVEGYDEGGKFRKKSSGVREITESDIGSVEAFGNFLDTLFVEGGI